MNFSSGIRKFGRWMDVFRRVVLSLLFWLVVILLIVGFASGGPPRVRNGSLLVVRPFGRLVYAYSFPVNYGGIPVDVAESEVLLDDLVAAIEMGAKDSRIVGLWVDLNELTTAGYAAVAELSNAVAGFRESGKPVLASADYFDNARYRIVSAADYIIVDRLGEVHPVGYGFWQAYLGETMKMFGIDVQLFRSEESKAAVERLVLDEMSETVRENEERLFGDLWGLWLDEVSRNREVELDQLVEWIDNYDKYLAESSGDGADAALRAGLVDAIETGGVFTAYLEKVLGTPKELDAIAYVYRNYKRRRLWPTIAVVPVVGPLVYGEGIAGIAGSHDVIDAIDRARNTPKVKALVLRIDSTGGDVWAGESIRRAVEETREEWDLPVVASLGDSAASGAYWVAIEADLIVTRPETITGSIGVFTFALSFEEALSKWLGVKIDGLGTTPWTGIGHPGRALDERYASLLSLSVSDIDRLFRRIVAEKRGLSEARVDELAGGVWSGMRALDYRLVDEKGGGTYAIAAAAELAGLTKWDVMYFERELGYREELLGRLFWGARARRAAGQEFSLF